MGLSLVTAPAVEPVTLAEARLHLKSDTDVTADDTLISALIVAARELAEAETRRALITQTWKLTLDEFPADCDPIRVPRPNLLTVTGITYVDTDGATQTLASSTYTVLTDRLPGEIHLAYDEEWPETRAVPNAVAVTFTCGYGAAASAVPGPIKAAMLLDIGDLYVNRESAIVGTIRTENPAAKALRAPYLYREAI